MSETKALALKIEKLNRAQAIAQSQINNYKNTAEPEVANVHELVCIQAFLLIGLFYHNVLDSTCLSRFNLGK